MKKKMPQYIRSVCLIILLTSVFFPLFCILFSHYSIFSPICSVWANEKITINKTDFAPEAGVMLCTDKGDVLYSQNHNKGFVPASTIKVLTSLVALHYLGEDYRFQTHFFIESSNIEMSTEPNTLKESANIKKIKRDDKSGSGLSSDYSNINLKVKGYGDPLFTSAIIHDACRQVSSTLKSMNIFAINDIIVDSSFFAPNIKVDGTSNTNNPYDAFVGALSANFNTVAFRYDKTKKSYVSDDPEIPLFPFVAERVKSASFYEDRVILSEKESKVYAGILIKYFLQKEGFTIKGEVKTGVATDKDKLIYKFISPYNMDEIIRKLLKYSSNFMANQLFLSAGAKAYSPPATIDKGIAAMRDYTNKIVGISLVGKTKSVNSKPHNLELTDSNIVFAEGSGLSRKNRISPQDMIKILRKFTKHYELMKSETMSDGVIEYYKTGTLNGVKTRCGYFITLHGLYPFVVMVNEYGVGYDKMIPVLSKMVSAYENKNY
ncbi:MAG: D-alanyl-D-alanine carboxypeptidase [Desulfamplus sp.]|nr:D-alanyl-D-alanine carboxypeptidase [Desulfamplus sp.]